MEYILARKQPILANKTHRQNDSCVDDTERLRIRSLLAEGVEHDKRNPQTYSPAQIRQMYEDHMSRVMKIIASK